LLIAALCVAPVAASYVVYYFAPPARHTNHGELMGLPPLPDTRLRLADGAEFSMKQLRGKWVLLTVDSAQCAEPCRRKLFTLRQLRLSQGKDMERIERAFLINDDAALADGMADDFRGSMFVRAAASELLNNLPAQGTQADYIYVIDPLGNIVLRYTRNADPAGMIKDLTRLLKTSGIG
jgi:cytochrome oxidase Cu insertion factor (SCO1/SenC/PrrC family)